MKKRAVSLLVVSLVVPINLGLSGCKSRPPDPPAKKKDPLTEPVQPLDGNTNPSGDPSTTNPSTGGTPTSGTTTDGTMVNISISPIAVDSFTVQGMTGLWINTKKSVSWADASALCKQYGSGWDLPALTQVIQLGKMNASQDAAKKQLLDGLADGRYWTTDTGTDGKHCAQATTSTKQSCDGFEAVTSSFKVLCFTSKAS